MLKTTQLHADIKTLEDGSIQAIAPTMQLLVIPSEGSKHRAFNRNGLQRNLKTGKTTHIRWLVGELDGVRCYIQDNQIILTKRDLYP